VVAAAALVAGLVWLSHAPFLRIETVTVTGVRSVASSSIQTLVRQRVQGVYGYLFAKDNILLYPQDEIAAALAAKYPQFKVVEVQAADFSTVKVTVVEREPKALWCLAPHNQAGSCYFMDEDGVVYAPAPTFSAPVYISYRGTATGKLPRQYLSKEEFHALSAFAGAIAQKESPERLESVSVDGLGDVRLRFENDFTVLFSLNEEGGDIFERYVLARTAEPFAGRPLSDFEYLDLRFGDKLYYKERQ
ncbi:MAG: hypothetical protein AAB964_01625, partial [Patescibacteria group bacterium]